MTLAELLAQMPGTDEVVEAAARESWVAALLVIIVVSTFVTFGLVIRQILKEARDRENCQVQRITDLEQWTRAELLRALGANTDMMRQVLDASAAILAAAQHMQETLDKCSGCNYPQQR
jgi:hypothetical protein